MKARRRRRLGPPRRSKAPGRHGRRRRRRPAYQYANTGRGLRAMAEARTLKRIGTAWQKLDAVSGGRHTDTERRLRTSQAGPRLKDALGDAAGVERLAALEAAALTAAETVARLDTARRQALGMAHAPAGHEATLGDTAAAVAGAWEAVNAITGGHAFADQAPARRLFAAEYLRRALLRPDGVAYLADLEAALEAMAREVAALDADRRRAFQASDNPTKDSA